MAAAATAFDSLTGRRGVDIGTSFTRAWNERTGKTTKRSKDYPNPEYYSLRYKFKPESIDNEAAGTLTPKGGDGHAFELELPSQQHGDSHRFTAVEQPSKEWECVLLWDPATQQLTLEKLESTLNLSYDGRAKGTLPASATPPPSASGPSRTKRPAPGGTAARDNGLDMDLEKALTGYSDAEGEPDDDIDIQAEIEAIAGVTNKQEEEEEEEEEEMELVDVEPTPPPPPPSKVKAPHRAPVKQTTKAKSKGRARGNTSAKGEATAKGEVDGIEEEELNFGEPTKRARHPRRSSTIHNSIPPNTSLALPVPHTQNRHAPPTPSDLLRPPPTTHIVYAGSESESEESDEGGEVDAAALERELELELAEGEPDEDERMETVQIRNGQHNSGRPLSLNELFGEQSQGDDDTTSDDSDDD